MSPPSSAQIADELKPKEAEQALIATLLAIPSQLAEVRSTVKPEDFYIEGHRRIFQVMLDLHRTGQQVSPQAVVTELKERGQLDDWPTEAADFDSFFFQKLLPQGMINEAQRFADLVADRAHRRTLLQAQAKLATAIYDLSKPVAELVAAAQSQFAQVQAARPARWKVSTLEDAYKPRPPKVYLVEGLIPACSLSILYGASGCLKSMLAADAALCVSQGLPWLEPLPGSENIPARKTTKARVLWLDFDQGDDPMAERLEALARTRDIVADDGSLFYCVMPDPWLNPLNQDSLDELQRILDYTGAELVIIDNLGAVSGGVDENSVQMVQVMSAYRQLAHNNRIAVLIIHHSRKEIMTKARKGESLRGHTSIEAALDLALMVERESERSPDIKISSTKSRGADVVPFAAHWTFEHRPGTTELLSARFFGRGLDQVDPDADLSIMVLHLVTETPDCNQTQLLDLVQKSKPAAGEKKIVNTIKKLVDAKILEETRGLRNAKTYRILQQPSSAVPQASQIDIAELRN